jgi:rhodanese-related sulfurtransferase
MENISVSEVRSRLQAGEHLNLVDVREADENAEFNIGGILLPFEKIQNLEFDDIEDLKDQELIFYCRTGNRSTQACLFLEMTGFSNCKNLAGGLVEWKETLN